MKKRLFMTAAVLLVMSLSLPLFADGHKAVWHWQLDDPKVIAFRYQLNGDDPANWTYVSGDIDTFEYGITDSANELTLYLQRSYDGLNWSETVTSTVTVEVEEADVPSVEEPAGAEVPAEDVEVEAPALTTADADSSQVAEIVPDNPVEVQHRSVTDRFSFSLLLRAGVGNRLGSSPFFANGASNMRLDFGLGLDFANIISLGDHFGLGLRADISATLFPGELTGGWGGVGFANFFTKFAQYVDVDSSADLNLMIQYERGPVVVYAGSGFGYSIFNQANTTESGTTHTLKRIKLFGASFDTAMYVPVVLGGRYQFTDLFSLGLELSGRYMIPSYKFIASGELVAAFSF